MSFVLVTADFPEIESSEFDVIFSRLEQENWIKLHEHSNPVNTIWFNAITTERQDEAIRTARHNFTACCIPYCIPRLKMEWGTNDQFAYNIF